MDSTTDVGAIQFQNWPVSSVYSLAFRFEPQDSRTGIYILSFANGERYVGQSLDVVNRFSSHRRRWADITYLAFRPFPAEELNLREREVLVFMEQQGYRVRDLDLAGRPGGDSVLNVVMDEPAQAEWQESDASEPLDAPRYVAAARRMADLHVSGNSAATVTSQNFLQAPQALLLLRFRGPAKLKAAFGPQRPCRQQVAAPHGAG